MWQTVWSAFEMWSDYLLKSLCSLPHTSRCQRLQTLYVLQIRLVVNSHFLYKNKSPQCCDDNDWGVKISWRGLVERTELAWGLSVLKRHHGQQSSALMTRLIPGLIWCFCYAFEGRKIVYPSLPSQIQIWLMISTSLSIRNNFIDFPTM